MSVTEFVIHRSKWARGAGCNFLLNADGRQCCVGIYLSACGVHRSDLKDYGVAATVATMGALPAEASWLVDGLADSVFAQTLYEENDGKAREHQIARLFAEQGITVRFED